MHRRKSWCQSWRKSLCQGWQKSLRSSRRNPPNLLRHSLKNLHWPRSRRHSAFSFACVPCPSQPVILRGLPSADHKACRAPGLEESETRSSQMAWLLEVPVRPSWRAASQFGPLGMPGAVLEPQSGRTGWRSPAWAKRIDWAALPLAAPGSLPRHSKSCSGLPLIRLQRPQSSSQRAPQSCLPS
jgi:hypothetical protein